MLKLTVDPIVLQTLKRAMPKTDKADHALSRYVEILRQMMEQALLRMDTNLYRHYKYFNLSTHDLSNQVGQYRINGERIYLHSWLEKNNVALVYNKEPGLKGKSYSQVKLTDLVTVTDTMDVTKLKGQKVKDLEKLLRDPSLNDADFFYRMFPDFVNPIPAQIRQDYDYCPINIKSLKQFFVWLTLRANKINEVDRQLMVRHTEAILRIAQGGDGTLPMKKINSPFGRTYYEGINVQSVHGTLREGMLGKCYAYDIRTSVVSWKMGFAELCYNTIKNPRPFDVEFGASLAYLSDRTSFRNYVRIETFRNDMNISDDLQADLIKQALTALSFGARMTRNGWIDHSGKDHNPAIVKILRNPIHRDQFINCPLMQQFKEEQNRLDKFIYNYYKKADPSFLKNPILETSPNRPSSSKVMSYLYQHAETIVMNIVKTEVQKMGMKVLAVVHDGIYIDKRLALSERQEIEELMRSQTGIECWSLDEEKLEGYRGISAQVRLDEIAHKKFIADQERIAAGYKKKHH